MAFLSADLVPSIADPAVAMLLVRLDRVQRAPQSLPGREVGTITARVVEVFRGASLKAGDSIRIPFERMTEPLARAKNASDHWNVLDLNQGDLLLLACQRSAPPDVWQGLAANQVPSSTDREVVELRRSYQIEGAQLSPDAKRTMLREALTDGKGILRRYALDAIARRGAVAREVGVGLVDEAIASEKTSPEEDLNLGVRLADPGLFDEARGDDPANRRVISVLARGLVAETDAERRSRWLRVLASRVLMEFSEDPARDREVRLGLIRATGHPPAPKVAAVLEGLIQSGPEGDRPLASDLLEAWNAPAD